MRQYYILTLDPNARDVFKWIYDNALEVDVHLNRTRFWVPEGPLLTEFLLRYAHCCPIVDETLDSATGLPRAVV